jgi:cbb3-type cytochrome oxidase maturation protein
MSLYMMIDMRYLTAMGTIFLLTGLAFGLFVIGTMLLTWGVRSGQWDDLDTPAHRILGDDPPARKK